MNPIPELAPQLKQLRLSGILDSLDARTRCTPAIQGLRLLGRARHDTNMRGPAGQAAREPYTFRSCPDVSLPVTPKRRV